MEEIFEENLEEFMRFLEEILRETSERFLKSSSQDILKYSWKKSWRCSRNHRRNLLKSPLTFFEKFWKETKEILYIFQKKRSKMVKTEKFSENCIKDSMEVMDIRRILWEISEDLRE